MRIVLDTNVLVSAFVSKEGQSAKIVDILLTFPEINLVLSQQILQEFREVMLRQEVRDRFGYSARNVDRFVRELRAVASMVVVKSKLRAVKDDPKDDIMISTAVDGRAEWIVSGDMHLQRLRKFRNIRMVSPRQMLRVISDRFG